MKKLYHKKYIKRWYFIFIPAFLFIIIYFMLMDGTHLVNLDYKTIEKLMPLAEPFYDAANDVTFGDFGSRVDADIANAAVIADIAKAMEHIIHVILFFGLVLVFLIIFKKVKMKTLLNVTLSVTLCAFLAYFNEMIQNGVSGRGYERIDVVHNLEGTGIGLLIFLFSLLIKRLIKKRPNKNNINSIEIKYFLSNEEFITQNSDVSLYNEQK